MRRGDPGEEEEEERRRREHQWVADRQRGEERKQDG